MAKRSNSLFQRLMEAGSKTTYHKRTRGARHQDRLAATRQREAEREEIRRERQKVQEANKLKRQLMAEDRREEKRRRKEEERDAPHKAMPSASAIERAYKRGAKSLSEAMEMARGNPASYRGKSVAALEHMLVFAKAREYDDDWMVRQQGRRDVEAIEHALKNARKREAKRNPRGSRGKFRRCVEAVTKKGGARDPQAVCGAMEKRLRSNPDGMLLTSGLTLAEAERRARKLKSDDVKLRKLGGSGNYESVSVHPTFERPHGRKEYGVFVTRRNPADAAMAVSEEFHGRKVKAMIPVQQKRHYHKYLAELGELRKLEVLARDGKHKVTVKKFDGAMLCTNEDKNQLFIVGGDQAVNLADFGIRNPHEVETLGEVVKIEYFTDKEHLGSEGGEAVYVHKFRGTNDNGRHKTVRLARNPDLIYYMRDEHLEFSGGSYEIRAEGIDK